MDDLHEDHNETIVVNGSHEEYDGHNEDRTHDENIATMGAGVVAAKKKKKKSKSKSKRGLTAPTGFEEYYVDAPITPDEYEVERGIYHPGRPFTERIQSAIQRYKAKRNLDPERKDLFDKYMVYGGVDSGPKMFGGGLDSRTLEESTAADIAAFTATNYVSDDKEGKEYVVDFDGCVKGFISSRLAKVFDVSTEKQIKARIAVIRNFLNYLLHHDVCPEHKDQIDAARATCDRAEIELWSISQATSSLPGEFNVACSTIFGGYYENSYVGDQEWAKGLNLNGGMNPEKARKVFKFGLAAHGNDELVKEYNYHVSSHQVRVVEIIETGLEITELIPGDKDVQELYANFPGLHPIGKLKANTWYLPAPRQDDLTVEEEANPPSKEIKDYTLWAEDKVLAKCFVGMKLQVVIRKLSFGVYYMDNILGIYCSFYDILPNEFMLGWREHVYLEPRATRIEPEYDELEGEDDGKLEEISGNPNLEGLRLDDYDNRDIEGDE